MQKIIYIVYSDSKEGKHVQIRVPKLRSPMCTPTQAILRGCTCFGSFYRIDGLDGMTGVRDEWRFKFAKRNEFMILNEMEKPLGQLMVKKFGKIPHKIGVEGTGPEGFKRWG